MTDIPHGAWIVVADGEKALTFENVTDAQDPNLSILRKREEENPPDREQSANRRGRVQESAGSGVSAYDDTDFHDQQKDRFAADLADRLYAQAHRGEFEKLILVASPQVLGVLRDKLHKEVRDKVIAEVDKTLTNHPVEEIEKVLKAELKG